jgi:hypothetical protein
LPPSSKVMAKQMPHQSLLNWTFRALKGPNEALYDRARLNQPGTNVMAAPFMQ